MSKAAGRAQFERKVLAGAEAGIDIEDDGQRQFRFFSENRNFLRMPVFEYLKVIFGQTAHWRAVLIGDGDENIYEFDVYFDVAGVVSYRLGPGGFRDTAGAL